MTAPDATGRIRAIVFDLGGVLLDWNPRYLYRKLFDGDDAAMERFLAEVCTMEWHQVHDLGVPSERTCAELARAHPDQAELIWAWSRRSEEMISGSIDGTVTILSELKAAGVRATVDDRSEKVNLKIRDAQMQKVPWMLVVGGREADAGQVAVRHRKRGDLGPTSVEEFTRTIIAEIAARSID